MLMRLGVTARVRVWDSARCLVCAGREKVPECWAIKNLEARVVIKGLTDLLLRVSCCPPLPLFVVSNCVDFVHSFNYGDCDLFELSCLVEKIVSFTVLVYRFT